MYKHIQNRCQNLQNVRIVMQIYEKSCKADQIMVPYEGLFIEKHDYFISDMCQIAKHDLLNEYWNSMPEFDGSYAISPEV